MRCFLHRESLVMKKVSVEPSSVLNDVVDQRPGPSSSSYHRQVVFWGWLAGPGTTHWVVLQKQMLMAFQLDPSLYPCRHGPVFSYLECSQPWRDTLPEHWELMSLEWCSAVRDGTGRINSPASLLYIGTTLRYVYTEGPQETQAPVVHRGDPLINVSCYTFPTPSQCFWDHLEMIPLNPTPCLKVCFWENFHRECGQTGMHAGRMVPVEVR